MKISRSKKKAEAVLRRELFGFYPKTIRQFQRHNLVSVSELPLGDFLRASNADCKLIKNSRMSVTPKSLAVSEKKCCRKFLYEKNSSSIDGELKFFAKVQPMVKAMIAF